MLQDSLATDKLIAMALLSPGWELSYGENPPIHSHVCIGQVISHTPTDDDRHNIFLLGLARAKIVRELETPRSFRMAEVELIEDVYPSDGAATRMQLHQSLLSQFRQFIPEGTLAQENFQQLLSSHIPLGMLTDIIAFSLGISLEAKAKLLATADVDKRGALLLNVLDGIAHAKKLASPPSSAQSEFPPKFSLN